MMIIMMIMNAISINNDDYKRTPIVYKHNSYYNKNKKIVIIRLLIIMINLLFIIIKKRQLINYFQSYLFSVEPIIEVACFQPIKMYANYFVYNTLTTR